MNTSINPMYPEEETYGYYVRDNVLLLSSGS